MNRVSGIEYWVLSIGHRVSGIEYRVSNSWDLKLGTWDLKALRFNGLGFRGSGFRDFCVLVSLCSCVFVPLCLCVLAPSAQAQDAIEIESSLVTVESELELEDLLAAREKAVVETQVHLSTDQEDSSNEPATRLRQDSFDPSALRESVSDEPSSEVIAEEDVLKINQTLRRVIEQNRRLQDEKDKMEQELGRLRGESRVADKRRKELLEKVSAYEDRVQQAMEVQQTLDETVADIKTKVKTREEALLSQIRELQQQMEKNRPEDPKGDTASASVSPLSEEENAGLQTTVLPEVSEIARAQQQGLDVIRLMDNLDEMRRTMSEDEARIHYNMGNIFFHQGKYSEAAKEYHKALDITPQDANSHFNLALVSGDFLHEYETALNHYQQYLFLNPEAEDAPLVQEKILEAQLYVRSWDDKDVDRETHADRPRELYAW